MTIAILLAGFLALTSALHFGGIGLLWFRFRRPASRPVPNELPPVSVLMPVCGLENHLEATLASAFALDHTDFEVIFCVASPHDPALALIHRQMRLNQRIPSRLLVGDEEPSANPKLNNLIKGWDAARHGWVLMADSNVLLPPDAVHQMLARWDEDTGLVCSPPLGSHPLGAGAELEAAFLNTYQARWQLLADAVGFGFAQGKAMLWRREDLDRAGGPIALASEPGEDAAATKLLRAAGKRVRLVADPFRQPLGRRIFRDVLRRQVRWARLRRATFPLFYMPELIAGACMPFAALAGLVLSGAVPWQPALSFPLLWYGAEAILARRAGWPLSWRSPLAWIARDLIVPGLWIAGWGRSFVWRGHGMDTTSPPPGAATRRLARQLARRPGARGGAVSA